MSAVIYLKDRPKKSSEFNLEITCELPAGFELEHWSEILGKVRSLLVTEGSICKEAFSSDIKLRDYVETN